MKHVCQVNYFACEQSYHEDDDDDVGRKLFDT